MEFGAWILAVGLTVGAKPAAAQIDPASSVVDRSPADPTVSGVARPALGFDVVSVKRVTVPRDGASIESRPDSDGVTIRNLALEWIVDWAYDFTRPELVTGFPEWAKTDRYDVVAKVSDENVAAFRNLGQAERRLMMETMLEDRFGLKVHREPKQMEVYALVLGKAGVKMKVATPGDTYANGPKYPNGSAAGPGTLTPTGGGIVGQAAQMEALALMLSKVALGREVVDETGLTGRYDFTLHFAPTEAMRPVINGQMAPLSAEDEAQPSVFTALQEQLGLRLESRKATVEGMVVDRVERPSEN